MGQPRSTNLTPGVAFITGGGRGLGNAIAVSFAKDGAKGVALVDISDEKTFAEGKAAVEKANPDCKCITVHCDVSHEAGVERAVAETVKEFGRIDYAANFAGIVGPLAATWETDFEAWRKVLEVNTFGVWLCMKHEMKQMLSQTTIGIEQGRQEQKGSIVNAASVNSIQAGAGTTGYSGSKHAVLGMTKAAALEGRAAGIRVNCVSPGFLRTKLLEVPINAMGGWEGERWGQFEARQGRLATFDEIGDVVVLLSNPRMSLVVGHNLVIDGGFTINEDTS